MNVTVTDKANQELRKLNRQDWLIKYQTDDCG